MGGLYRFVEVPSLAEVGSHEVGVIGGETRRVNFGMEKLPTLKKKPCRHLIRLKRPEVVCGCVHVCSHDKQEFDI